MLDFLSDNPWAYGFVVLALVTFAYGLWQGFSEIREESRRYADLVGDLFNTVPHNEVLKSSRYPFDSVIGSVKIDGISKVRAVLQGRDGLFIEHDEKASWVSIPWNRVDKIDSESSKRIVVYVKREGRPPIALSLPWSRKMSLENWHAYQAASQ